MHCYDLRMDLCSIFEFFIIFMLISCWVASLKLLSPQECLQFHSRTNAPKVVYCNTPENGRLRERLNVKLSLIKIISPKLVYHIIILQG